MEIEEVANRLNEYLAKSELADFQMKRAKRLGLQRPAAKSFFSGNTISTENGYAYHSGGQQELQFNIGFETRPNREEIFRYGLALSFQTSQSVPDPLPRLIPRAQALNELIEQDDPIFNGMKMWFFDKKDNFHDVGRVRKIRMEWMKAGFFIFVGFEVPAHDLNFNHDLFLLITKTFERLLTVYHEIENRLYGMESRAIRLCWNTERWQRPSGPDGKRRKRDAFESEHGFGLEEWLFDTSKVINGYHYSFLQPFNLRHTYQGRQFDAYFYCMNDRTKQKFWVARITGLIAIRPEEEEMALKAYKKNGWLDEMRTQVTDAGGKDVYLSERHNPMETINCKFDPDTLTIFDWPWIELEENEIRSFYYDTLSYINPKARQRIVERLDNPETVDLSNLEDFDGSGISDDETSNRNGVSAGFFLRSHKLWQKNILEMLRSKYGRTSVGIEVPLSGGRADIVIVWKSCCFILELKTANTAIEVIRQSLGQLLQYAYKKDADKYHHHLIAAGPARSDETGERFIAYLRDKYNMSISYVRYDPATNELVNLELLINTITNVHSKNKR